jgi:hypothetical protein
MVGVAGAHRIPRTQPGAFLAQWDAEPHPYRGFNMSDEELLRIAGMLGGEATGSRSMLDEQERRVAHMAVHDLAGTFKIDDIYARLGPLSKGGISRRWLVDLARKWERCGWLVSDPSNPTIARTVTDALVEKLNDAS